VSATGIGLVIALASTLFELGGASSQVGGMFSGLWATMKGAFGAISEALAPVVRWLKTEIPILLHAVAQGFSQLILAVVEMGKAVWSVVGPIAEAVGRTFLGVAKLIASTFGVTANNMSELWTELVAEISVLGLRAKQAVLVIAIGFVGIGQSIRWVWDMLVALGDFVRDSFANAFTNGISRISNSMGILKALVKDLAKAFFDFVKHPWRAPSFDFSETQAAMAKFNQDMTGEKHAKLDVPEFNPAGDLKKEFYGTQTEITRLKETSRRDQAAARAKAGLPDGDAKKGESGSPHLKVGTKDKVSISNADAFWKKLQESVPGDESKDHPQLKEAKSTNQWLEKIYKTTEGKKKGDGKNDGVFPR
jgi:hypothetical protein